MKEIIERKIEKLRLNNDSDREYMRLLDLNKKDDRELYDMTKEKINMRDFAIYQLEEILKEL